MNLPAFGAAAAQPSLALVKYWGKADIEKNLPATPSLAVTLDGLYSETRVTIFEPENGEIEINEVYIDGVHQESTRFQPFFRELRKLVSLREPRDIRYSIRAESSSNFPLSAGLASSSSGFAALACACSRAAGLELSRVELSSLARVGSASAARSLYGGFTKLEAGAEYAEQIHDKNWWPEFRIIVVEIEKGPKAVSSRRAMEQTRESSPYYESWLKDSQIIMEEATAALETKDLGILGPLIRKSYLRMFATMFSSDPPVIYWHPDSLSLIHLCEEMRAEGISVWETMDAGPQLKLFCTEDETGVICSRLKTELPHIDYRVCSPGGGPLMFSI